MSDQDNFIARWSRLKREAAQDKKARADPNAPDRGPPDARAGEAAAPNAKHPSPEPPFDPATLPPIDSIVAGSDIRAFLQKGVPAALTRAALRRAWTTDLAIRDFIGLAENQWDFTDPTAIPGFGPLDATGDLPQLVSQAPGELPDAPDPAGLSEESRAAPVSAQAAEAPALPALEKPDDQDDQDVTDVVASQHPEPAYAMGNAPSQGGDTPARKGHGRALPR